MKNKYIAKRYWKNTDTAMAASGKLAGLYPDLINLAIGDPDLTTDSRIIEAAMADAELGHTHYTGTLGDAELLQAIGAYYREMYRYEIPGDGCIVTASACHGMWLALEAILDDGDEVIIPDPYFTPYPYQVELARGVPVFLPTYESENFQIDIGRLERLITPRTKAIILNTPNNPTGSCLSLETLQKVGKIAEQYDLLLIADDIYTIFSFENPFIPVTTLPGLAERTITVCSFSKDYCMTGWRIGYNLAPPEIVAVMRDINENVVYTAPAPSQRAALHALKLRHQVQPAIIDEFKTRLDYAYQRICQIDYLSVLPVRGSIYLFVNIQKTGLTSAAFCRRLLEHYHINAISGEAFGACGEGYVRLALTVGVPALKEAFDRLDPHQF